MTAVTIIPPNNKSRALAAIERSRAAIPMMPTMAPRLPVPTPAEQIAGGMTDAVAAVIEKMVPYGARGTLEAEADIEHRSPDGSATRAQVRLKFRAEGRS